MSKFKHVKDFDFVKLVARIKPNNLALTTAYCDKHPKVRLWGNVKTKAYLQCGECGILAGKKRYRDEQIERQRISEWGTYDPMEKKNVRVGPLSIGKTNR